MSSSYVSVVHLSDLHFGAGAENALAFKELEGPLIDLIKGISPAPVVLMSGDITFRGKREGYEHASRFFETIRRATGLERNRFLACPGNHDIVSAKEIGNVPEGFKEFDRFIYSLRRDQICNFTSRSCLSIAIDDAYFLVVNSAFHLDKGFGLVNIDDVAGQLNLTPPPRASHSRVAVVHHNPIPITETDSSTIRNAYHLLTLLDENRFGILLHGHQHTTTGLAIGKTPVTSHGVSSFNFSTEGRLNGLYVHKIGANKITSTRHTLITDGKAGDQTGYGVIIPPTHDKST